MSVSDNSGNSPQMAAPRRSREIDQSTQFHVGRGYANHGIHLILDNTLNVGEMILILTKSSSFCNIVCGNDTSFGAAIFILILNHADVIGDQSDAVTQNAWYHCALCAAISEEISILIQTGAESWGRFPVPRICRWESSGPIAAP